MSTLYRFYADDDSLVYVGITATRLARVRGHASKAHWRATSVERQEAERDEAEPFWAAEHHRPPTPACGAALDRGHTVHYCWRPVGHEGEHCCGPLAQGVRWEATP